MPRSPKASSAGQPARRAGRRDQRAKPLTTRRAAPNLRMPVTLHTQTPPLPTAHSSHGNGHSHKTANQFNPSRCIR